MTTLTRAETTPFVETVLYWTPPELVPVFAGQVRLESALITQFDIVLHADEISEPPGFEGSPIKVSWDPFTKFDVRAGRGYIRLAKDMPVNLWQCPTKILGPVVLNATGPPEFTSALKRKAQRKSFILRQNGLFFNGGLDRLDDGTERSIFRMLDVPWMEPVDRNAFSKMDFRDHEVIEREVPASRGNKTYLVRILGDRANCPCPGFQYRHQCRHVTQLRQDLGLPTPLRTDVLPP